MKLVDYEKYYHSGSEFIIPRDEFAKIIEENQRLNNVLNELRENAIAFINIFQDEKTLTLNYNDLKHLRGIINGEEFDIRILKNKLQELKESDK